MKLDGARMVVAGGGGCLGSAIVAALLAAGARVAVLDRVEGAAAGEALRLVCDLAEPSSVAAALVEVETALGGPVQGLVNAAGHIRSIPLVNVFGGAERSHALSAWDDILRANLTTAFVTTAAVADRMVATRTRGAVVSLGSIAAGGNPGQGAYAAAKAGLAAASAAWARELGTLGLRFVVIEPGFIDTPSTRAALTEAQLEEWRRRGPLRRLGTPEDVAETVLHALRCDYLTAQTVQVAGGLSV
ncbi:hypothetical protein A6A04_10560 [Paramagnetospirillum marisnigri]|uniref:Ketoreductase domain-containing protein n=1 Tax=Paramagnetospirillum marisnigri TaxID=1285242 RepID=A0A178MZK8_9PROT|nr:SDR family oxidoreductase [Paramagnetospirillum marisnigri]OAN55993.1 hypothetical protein A6A04_10560 [Paramagnetospirillum marisnigri]